MRHFLDGLDEGWGLDITWGSEDVCEWHLRRFRGRVFGELVVGVCKYARKCASLVFSEEHRCLCIGDVSLQSAEQAGCCNYDIPSIFALTSLNDTSFHTANIRTEVVIAPPSLYLLLARSELRAGVEVAAQNVFDKDEGAYTGEISPAQLKDSNISWTLLGHSERRVLLSESDDFVASKTKNALAKDVHVILCCGESLEQREKGETIAVVTRQLGAVAKVVTPEQWSKIVIAYEPIWAIGTGKVATTAQAQEVHAAIREWLKKEVGEKVAADTRIIYGGSVSDKNCKDLATQPDIDGFLVGGASLKPACEFAFSFG